HRPQPAVLRCPLPGEQVDQQLRPYGPLGSPRCGVRGIVVLSVTGSEVDERSGGVQQSPFGGVRVLTAELRIDVRGGHRGGAPGVTRLSIGAGAPTGGRNQDMSYNSSRPTLTLKRMPSSMARIRSREVAGSASRLAQQRVLDLI